MTSGRADSVLKGSHVTRSRYVHQVSACAIYLMQKIAYQEYIESCEDKPPKRYEAWIKEQSELCPQFKYWATVLDLEILLLQFVKATREGNFQVYLQVLGKVLPWFFAMNLSNYSRWLPVHVRDLLRLEKTHPTLFTEFSAHGKFVVQKSQHRFSMMSLDQNHEQENEMIKGDGGAVGLTECPTALRRWMIAGPEIARLVREFECSFGVQCSTKNITHHEQTPSVQKNFAKDVKSMSAALKEFGNPFMENSKDLIVVDTKEIEPECVIESIYTARKIGEAQYTKYVEERLEKCNTPITDTIERNKLPLFGTSVPTTTNKTKLQVTTLKNDCNLFARLYIACQSREGNLQEFFKHENQSTPPSLSSGDKMRSGQKSELIDCLEADVQTTCPNVDVKILDAAAIVNMLSPGKCKTFQEYSKSVFVPYIVQQANGIRRIDLVWDRYIPDSLKQGTRSSRGAVGARRRVCDMAVIPANWKSFLRSDDNKQELFKYLSQAATSIQLPNVTIVSTFEEDIISSKPIEKDELAPCNHEEADTRIFIHANHAAKGGMRKIVIRTVDTDVVVLAIANVHKLDVDELWIAFGVGKHMRYLPIHNITQSSLSREQCEALPFFHAVTGCDTVSFFAGKGKKTAFQAWKSFPDVTSVFQLLSSPKESISEEEMEKIERFIIIMYSRTCPLSNINDARQAIFAQGTKTIDHIPPTQASLVQHIRRATYQAGHVWGQSLVSVQQLPLPSQWGWQNNGRWIPTWSTLPEASKACNELVHCGCKKACRGLCKCTKSNLPCTALCKCGGSCYQD